MFNREIAKQLWDQLQGSDGIKIASFEAAETFHTDEGGRYLVIATVSLTVALEMGPDSGIFFELMGIEVQLGKDGKIYLEPGLHVSPELRAVLTEWIVRQQATELREICQAVRSAAQPEPATEDQAGATEGLPDEVVLE